MDEASICGYVFAICRREVSAVYKALLQFSLGSPLHNTTQANILAYPLQKILGLLALLLQ